MRIVWYLWIAALIICVSWGVCTILRPSPRKAYTDIDHRVTLIDGCEYIVTTTYMNHETLTHKGNCTNMIHRAKN
jgi:hypothetical protein